tara:strand:- start:2308 stop:3186 length:879 start_codon:yes stop_codon:yes gene_type:complete
MKIHINSKPGIYEVEAYGRNSITLSTKHNTFQVPTSDFKTFAGGIWNNSIDPYDFAVFLSVVKPDQYKMQVEQEDQILTLAARLDIIQAKVKAEAEQVVHESQEERYERLEREHYEAIQAEQDREHQEWMREYEQEKANRSVIEWEGMLNNKDTELQKADTKLRDIAHRVYSQKLDFSNFQMHTGIKFIIQQDHYDAKINRFCWDPYGFVSNGHSDISSIYREADWGTISGGWIKIIDNNVVLYSKSGDYGVYDDAIAIECAKKIFPGKKIHSFAGRIWDDKLDDLFNDLPF